MRLENGSVVDAVPVGVLEPQSHMVEFKLADGSRVEVHILIPTVLRATTAKNPLGEPYYQLQQPQLNAFVRDIPERYMGPAQMPPEQNGGAPIDTKHLKRGPEVG